MDGEYSDLNKRISRYNPDKKKVELRIDVENIELLRRVVDSYQFYFRVAKDIVWHKFKNNLIYSENRMASLDIDEEVTGIVTDL